MATTTFSDPEAVVRGSISRRSSVQAGPSRQNTAISFPEESAEATSSKAFAGNVDLRDEDILPSSKALVESEIEALIVHFHKTVDDLPPNVSEIYPKVDDLLFGKGPENLMDTKDPDWRWIHLPANNMSWVRQLIQHLCEEISTQRPAGQTIDPVSILRSEFWKGRQHDGLDGPQGRFLKPLYTRVSPTSDILVDPDIESKTESSDFTCFIPYLHWEEASKYSIRNVALDFMSSINTQNAPGLVPEKESDPRFFAHLEEQKRIQLNLAKERNANISRPLRGRVIREEVLDGVSRHEKLVLAYINEPLPLHVRRTLDQFLYETLPDDRIRIRDLDQVLWRHTQQDTEPRILMVDQLWLWLIDDPSNPGTRQTVVTAFPERWSETNEWHNFSTESLVDRSDMRFRILQAINKRERKIESAFDLACLIIDKCAGIFHPRANETGAMEFLDAFEISIGKVADDQILCSDRFWHHSVLMDELQIRWKELAKAPLRDLFARRKATGSSPAAAESPEDIKTAESTGRLSRLHRVLGQNHSRMSHRGVDGPTQADEPLQDPIGSDLSYKNFKAQRLGLKTSSQVIQENLHQELEAIRKERNISKIESRMRREVDTLIRNAEETDCVREIKDIVDELGIVAAIFRTQQQVVEAMNNDNPKASRLLKTIRERLRDIHLMAEQANNVYRSLHDLLDLKQKQASVAEAHAASRQAEESTKQGQTIMLFTVTTVIYATLSVIAAIFSMNAQEINNTPNRSLKDIFVIMFPTTAVILIVALFLAYNSTLRWVFKGVVKWNKRPLTNKTSNSEDLFTTEQPSSEHGAPALLPKALASHFSAATSMLQPSLHRKHQHDPENGSTVRISHVNPPREEMTEMTRPDAASPTVRLANTIEV